jgi:thiamine-phosphate pyrophosphorylase
MTIPSEFGFYGILTDPLVGYERLAEVMVERRIRFVQLRMKHTPREQVLATARRLRPIVTAPSLLIINDDPRVAAEVGADGVHLGQDDMPYHEARAIVGPDAIIGLSTHDPDQTRAACTLGPAYIGVGPVFPTPTKAIPDPALGLDGMAAMLELATVPAVVLGSIDHDNAADVLSAGATNLCAVRAINQATDPADALDRLLAILEAGS